LQTFFPSPTPPHPDIYPLSLHDALPISLKIMPFYPLPNRTTQTQNFVLNNSRQDDTTRWFLRFDQALGTKQRLFFTLGRQNNQRSEEHTSELQSRVDLVCRLLLEKKNTR